MTKKIRATDVDDDIACASILVESMTGGLPRPPVVEAVLPVLPRRVRFAVLDRLVRRGLAEWYEPNRRIKLTPEGARLAASATESEGDPT